MHTVRLISRVQLAEEPNGAPIEIIYAGNFFHEVYGEFEISPENIDEMVQNFESMDGPDRVPIDCNHGSLSEGIENAVAMGWLQKLSKRDQGDRLSLMGEPLWNDSTLELIEDGAYRYLSAEIVFNDTNTLTGEKVGCRLLAVALTNRPFIPELEPVTLGAATDNPTRIELGVFKARAHREMAGMQCGESLIKQLDEIATAFYNAYPDSGQNWNLIEDIHDDALIILQINDSGQKFFSVPYINVDSGYTFGEWTEVQKEFSPILTANKSVGDIQSPDNQKDYSMEELAKIRELLGLDEDGSIEEAITALTDTANGVAELTERVESLATEVTALNTSKAEAEAALETAQAELTNKDAEVVTLTQTTEVKDAESVKLSERIGALEAEKAERDAGDRIKKALNDGKVMPAELDDEEGFLRNLAKDQPTVFDKVMAVRASNPVHDVELSGAEPIESEGEVTIDGFWNAVNELRDSAEGKELKQSEARAQVLREHPEFSDVVAKELTATKKREN